MGQRKSSLFVVRSNLGASQKQKAIAFETFLCPMPSKPEHLPRDDMTSLNKLHQEGTPSDNLTILGWIVNTSYLEASLPCHKRDLWILDTKVLLHSKVIQFKLLEQLIGKLNPAAAIIPMWRTVTLWPTTSLMT